MNDAHERTVAEKIEIFSSLFRGRQDIHGVWDPSTGRGYQVKKPITTSVIQAHLSGNRRLGLYVLVGDHVHAMAVDFDDTEALVPLAFVATARHYGIPSYIERSKSEAGHHAWILFDESGASAAKARLVAKHLLNEIEQPGTEVFPKQDALDPTVSSGNFIYLPLYGYGIANQERTVFLEESTLKPYPDQWGFLETIQRVPEGLFDRIIQANGLAPKKETAKSQASSVQPTHGHERTYGLPVCARRMLNEGVCSQQRLASLRLGIHLRRAGLSYELSVNVLKAWARKNHPDNGKSIIAEREIEEQTSWAFRKLYRGCGCEEAVVASFCDPSCPIHKNRHYSREPEDNDKIVKDANP